MENKRTREVLLDLINIMKKLWFSHSSIQVDSTIANNKFDYVYNVICPGMTLNYIRQSYICCHHYVGH